MSSEPQLPDHRETIELPVGFRDPKTGDVRRDAEVRPVLGSDELAIGLSKEYAMNPNDLIYKTLLLTRTVTRLGDKTQLSMDDIGNLHALDVRALEFAVFRITYGEAYLDEIAD